MESGEERPKRRNGVWECVSNGDGTKGRNGDEGSERERGRQKVRKDDG